MTKLRMRSLLENQVYQNLDNDHGSLKDGI